MIENYCSYELVFYWTASCRIPARLVCLVCYYGHTYVEVKTPQSEKNSTIANSKSMPVFRFIELLSPSSSFNNKQHLKFSLFQIIAFVFPKQT